MKGPGLPFVYRRGGVQSGQIGKQAGDGVVQQYRLMLGAKGQIQVAALDVHPAVFMNWKHTGVGSHK